MEIKKIREIRRDQACYCNSLTHSEYKGNCHDWKRKSCQPTKYQNPSKIRKIFFRETDVIMVIPATV